MAKYRRYTWIGGKISEEEMSEMYKIKKTKGIPITKQVAEAVKLFVKKNKI